MPVQVLAAAQKAGTTAPASSVSTSVPLSAAPATASLESQVASVVATASASFIAQNTADAQALGGTAVLGAIFTSSVASNLPAIPTLSDSATPDIIEEREAILTARDQAFAAESQAELSNSTAFERVKANAESAAQTVVGEILALFSAKAVAAAAAVAIA